MKLIIEKLITLYVFTNFVKTSHALFFNFIEVNKIFFRHVTITVFFKYKIGKFLFMLNFSDENEFRH